MIYSPSRKTVILSAIRNISFILCDTKMIPAPSSLRRRRIWNSFRDSLSSSEDVGSSSMRTRALAETALTISTIWRCATLRSPTASPGCNCTLKLRRYSPAARSILFRLTRPSMTGSRLTNMFSATVMVLHRLSSWKTVLMPSSRASRGFDGAISFPSRSTVPASRGKTPARILISVDFPAPFSPTSA